MKEFLTPDQRFLFIGLRPDEWDRFPHEVLGLPLPNDQGLTLTHIKTLTNTADVVDYALTQKVMDRVTYLLTKCPHLNVNITNYKPQDELLTDKELEGLQ